LGSKSIEISFHSPLVIFKEYIVAAEKEAEGQKTPLLAGPVFGCGAIRIKSKQFFRFPKIQTVD